MRRELVFWRVSLLAGLGFSITAGCGGKQTGSDDNDGDPGSAGDTNVDTGGAGTGGRTSATGGTRTTGGVDATGGVAPTGGVSPTGGASPTGGVSGREFTCTETADSESGLVGCEEEWAHRPEPASCTSKIPRDEEFDPDVPGACHKDADCEGPLEYCAQDLPGGTYCQKGCETDADCAEGAVCVCGPVIGECFFALCATDEDCPGSVCLGSQPYNGCGTNWQFACAAPEDECWVDADCGAGSQCTAQSGVRKCEGLPVCGRPFLVGGRARKARLRNAVSWAEPCALPSRELSEEARRAVVTHWSEMALMEHASVAAFSRFLLELLSLGAPAELVRDASRALGDEIAHAELCFALASSYAGRPIAPGALSIAGALDPKTAVEIGHTAFLEACLGEVQAVAEARAALEGAREPAVQSALSRIVEDEARHAELGFRFVKWLLDTLPANERAALSDAIEASLEQALSARASEPQLDGVTAPEHGLAAARAVAHARRLALVEVCTPCTRALLNGSGSVAGAHSNVVLAC
jgi:hypothetical protein